MTLKEFNALAGKYKNGQSWLDHRAALICSVLANIWRDTKKKTTPFLPEDFMPREKTVQQTVEQMFATVKMLNTAFGGEVLEN